MKTPEVCPTLPTFTPLPLNENHLPSHIHARAAKLELFRNEDVMTISFSHQRYDFTQEVSIPVSLSPDLGVAVQCHNTKPMLQILDCRKSTVASQIPRWQSLPCHTYIYSIDNIRV